MRTAKGKPAVMIAALALFVAACGGGGLSEQQQAAVAAAETNAAALQLTSDFSRSEVLDGHTGQITSLAEVVTGDRPVLMWYWAPT